MIIYVMVFLVFCLLLALYFMLRSFESDMHQDVFILDHVDTEPPSPYKTGMPSSMVKHERD